MGAMAEQERELFQEWTQDCPGLITDGLVDEAQYLASPVKLLFLMKEVNSGENWDLRDFLRNGGRPATWDNIARWTQGIHHLEKDFSWYDLERNNESRRSEFLKKICVVNVKKLSGGYTAIKKQIRGAAAQNAARLRQQLSIYQPDIILCCGTAREYSRIMGDRLDWKMTKRGILYLRDAGGTVISYAHPEARVRDCLLYYGLIDAMKEIMIS